MVENLKPGEDPRKHDEKASCSKCRAIMPDITEVELTIGTAICVACHHHETVPDHVRRQALKKYFIEVGKMSDVLTRNAATVLELLSIVTWLNDEVERLKKGEKK